MRKTYPIIAATQSIDGTSWLYGCQAHSTVPENAVTTELCAPIWSLADHQTFRLIPGPRNGGLPAGALSLARDSGCSYIAGVQQTTVGSAPRPSVRGRSTAGIVAVALAAALSAACDSTASRESANLTANAIHVLQSRHANRALRASIEECERAAGQDARRLADCVRSLLPDVTPLVLNMLDSRRLFHRNGESQRPAIDALIEGVASEAKDPVLRAAARYYVAAGLMRSANATWTEPQNRNARPPSVLSGALRRAYAARSAEARRRALEAATGSPAASSTGTTGTDAPRQAALEAATGLSAGVEAVAFPGWGHPGGPTFAEAEADLIRSIRHGTVGATLPEVTGRRLDGVEESLSDYRGRVVLLDFWATWCEPCVGALPELRDLVAELPADRFALVAISVDDEVATVTRFMEDEPMPWTNWHAGRGSAIERLLHVRGYPTYVLVDQHGKILARSNFDLASQLREAVAKLSPPA